MNNTALCSLHYIHWFCQFYGVLSTCTFPNLHLTASEKKLYRKRTAEDSERSRDSFVFSQHSNSKTPGTTCDCNYLPQEVRVTSHLDRDSKIYCSDSRDIVYSLNVRI